MARITRSQLVAGDAVWILTLTYAGASYRFATERVDITSSTPRDGTVTLAYSPGLQPPADADQLLAAVSDAPEMRAVPIELLWDDSGSATTLATLIQQGHDLAAARAEVALWIRGTDYEDRLPVVSGRVSEPEYGGRGEAIAFTVEDEPYDDVRRLVVGSISMETWPTAIASAFGAPYPWVFGQPGLYVDPTGTTAYAAGSPAYMVDLGDRILVAGHRVIATSVSIGYLVAGVLTIEGPYTISNEPDGLGQLVAVADLTSAAHTAALDAATAHWAIWTQAGALPSPYRSGAAVSTLGELLRVLADLSSVSTDSGAWSALAERLPWPVGGYVDDPDATPLGYAQDGVLPVAPIGLCVGDRGGLVPVLWRYDATAIDAVDHIEAGPGVSRSGRVRYERRPRDVAQEITLQWALDDAADEYRRRTTLTPERDPDDAEATTSALAIAAERRYRRDGEVRRSVAIDTAIVWNGGTAARIVHWMMRHRGYAPRLVDYDVFADRAWIRPGDVVTLTDSDLAITSTIALVVGRRLADLGVYRLTLQILDDLVTSIPVTGGGANGAPDWDEPEGG